MSVRIPEERRPALRRWLAAAVILLPVALALVVIAFLSQAGGSV